MEELNPRIRLLWIVVQILVAAILGGVVYGIDRWAFDLPAWAPIVAAILAVILGVVYALVRYQRWRFTLEEDALYLERGVITFVETSVPFVRVQHVDTHFGPVERLLGLSSVIVYTAGSRNADVRIPGLTPGRARQLRDRLRDRAIHSEATDAV